MTENEEILNTFIKAFEEDKKETHFEVSLTDEFVAFFEIVKLKHNKPHIFIILACIEMLAFQVNELSTENKYVELRVIKLYLKKFLKGFTKNDR